MSHFFCFHSQSIVCGVQNILLLSPVRHNDTIPRNPIAVVALQDVGLRLWRHTMERMCSILFHLVNDVIAGVPTTDMREGNDSNAVSQNSVIVTSGTIAGCFGLHTDCEWQQTKCDISVNSLFWKRPVSETPISELNKQIEYVTPFPLEFFHKLF